MGYLRTLLKKGVACTLVTTMLFSPMTLQAGALDSALEGMFVSTTAPGVYQSQTRSGFVGGSLQARIPVRNYNIVSFDPPRLSAGCGGIDMFGGSFSFINSDQLVAMMRNIGQVAKALLFKLALESINAMLGGVLGEFQKIMQDMNSLMKNTCSISSALLSNVKDTATGTTDLSTKLSGLFDSAKGTITGYYDRMEKAFSNPKEATGLTVDISNPVTANVAWRAMVDSKVEEKVDTSIANPVLIRELVMSIGGTEILVTPNDKASDDYDPTVATSAAPASCPAGQTCQNPTHERSPTELTVDDFMIPGNVKILACNGSVNLTSHSACQSMSEKSFKSVFAGTTAYVNKMLYGTNSGELTEAEKAIGASPDGILNKIKSGATLSSAELTFLGNIPQPIFAYFKLLQRNDDAMRNIAELAKDDISEQLAVQMAQVIVKAARVAFNADAVRVSKPGKWDENINQFAARINAKARNAQAKLDSQLKLQQYAVSIYQSLPGALLVTNKAPG